MFSKKSKNQTLKKALGLGLTFCMALAIAGTGIKASAANLKPGEVGVVKTAKPIDGVKDTFKVDLNVESKDLISTGGNADVVLVIDNSGSMGGTRIEKAKESAVKFVDKLISEGGNNRIAIVTYETDAKVRIGFSNDKNALNSAIDGITSEYSTYTQGGIYEARKLLETSARPGANKNLVLLCDGNANYRAKYAGITDDRVAIDHDKDHEISFTGKPNKFDYTSTSNIYEFDVTKKCGKCGQSITKTMKGSDYSMEADAQAAIDEGALVKKLPGGVNFYSVGIELNADSAGEKTLKAIQNTGYYNIKDVNDLQPLLEKIATEIKTAAGTKAVVTEKLSDNFTLVDGSIKASIGKATFDKNTNTITWEIGTLLEADKINLSYELLAKPELQRPNQYPVSVESKLNYRSYNGKDVSMDFPNVEVSVGLYKDVTVKFLEEGTNKELDKEIILKDKAVGITVDGNSYKKDIAGYDLVKVTPETLIVSEKDDENTIIVTYKKTPEKPVEPEKPVDPVKPEKPVEPTKPEKDENPKTGESNTSAGIAVISLITLGGLVLIKKVK